MSKQTHFNSGDPEEKLLSAKFLNDFLRRMSLLENMVARAPLMFTTSPGGVKTISLGRENPKWHCVQLKEDLTAGDEADAWIYTYDTQDRKHDGTTPYDIPTIKVKDSLAETGGCKDDYGIALEHLESKEKRYLWCGWPLGQGRHIQNYNKNQIQLLGHNAQGCLRWYDIVDCEDII